MEQAKIEQLAFLYLCSEHDKRLLLKKEKMPLADFDRLTYLIYHTTSIIKVDRSFWLLVEEDGTRKKENQLVN